MDTTSKIFVQIASYRDPECQYTVRDLFQKAANPDRITVGICWQFIPHTDSHCFMFETRPKQVRIKSVHAHEGKGVCWARHQTQQLWEGEKYTLQIDSHMRFVPGWDVKLIDELSKCNSPKPILSGDPPRYTPPDHLELNPKNSLKRANHFDKHGEMRFLSLQVDTKPPKPLKGAFIAAGFMFSDAKIIEEIPYDPYLYFNQEEATYSARLYTNGWDVYCPTEIILYHYYNIPENGKIKNTRPLHWRDVNGWYEMHQKAAKRYRHMMGQEVSTDPEIIVDLDKYGMGKVRTLENYSAFCGVNFKTREVSEKALLCEFVEDVRQYCRRPSIPPAAA